MFFLCGLGILLMVGSLYPPSTWTIGAWNHSFFYRIVKNVCSTFDSTMPVRAVPITHIAHDARTLIHKHAAHATPTGGPL